MIERTRLTLRAGNTADRYRQIQRNRRVRNRIALKPYYVLPDAADTEAIGVRENLGTVTVRASATGASILINGTPTAIPDTAGGVTVAIVANDTVAFRKTATGAAFVDVTVQTAQGDYLLRSRLEFV